MMRKNANTWKSLKKIESKVEANRSIVNKLLLIYTQFFLLSLMVKKLNVLLLFIKVHLDGVNIACKLIYNYSPSTALSCISHLRITGNVSMTQTIRYADVCVLIYNPLLF